MKTHILLATLATITSGLCGELVIKGNEELQGINLWLRSLDDAEAKQRLPDNHVEAAGDDKNPYRWKNVKPGKYVVCLDPDYEDWASHCIAAVPVTVGEGLTKLEVAAPSGSLDVTVKFDGVAEPNQQDEGSLVLRVERLDQSGKKNPYVCQWLWAEKKGGKLSGPLDYLEPGDYRIIAFSVDERYVQKDAASGELKVDAALLKMGSATVIINKKVEQAGTGQPATRPESKSEGGDKPQPEAEGRSR